MNAKIQSESEAAHLFRENYGDLIRFVPEKGEFIVKRETLWAFDPKGQRVEALVREFLDQQVATDARWKGSYSTVRNVRRLAELDEKLHVPIAQIDARELLFGTPSGAFSIAKKRVVEPKSGTYITQSTSVSADFDEECRRWTKFLKQVFEDDTEVIQFVQRWCGYLLTGSVKEQALLVLHGPGGNGKSVLINTVAAIMGTYHKEAASETFVESRTPKHETAMAHIAGARFVTSGETDQDGGWNEATMKRAVSGDWVTARFLYRNPFSYRPTYKIWIGTNHLPRLRSVGHAMRRRLHILRLNFVPKRPDPDLEQKLAEEHGALLAWMIEGSRAWLDRGLDPPKSVQSATDEYFDEEDNLGLWLKLKTKKVEGVATPTGALAESYNRFLRSRNRPEVHSSVFGRMLSARGYKAELTKPVGGRERTRCFVGIRLKANT
jgi:putative DNA primase/helicase